MRLSTKAAVGGSALLAMMGAAGAAQAGGFQAPELGVRANGMANAGAAVLRGADALAWNPAAIAGTGAEGVVGASWRRTSLDLSDDGSTLTRPGQATLPAGGQAELHDPAEDFTAPSLAFTLPLGDRFAAGVSVTKPFHLRLEYPADAFSRYDLTRNRIEMTEVRGALAASVTPWLDVGVSVDGQETRALLDAASPNITPASADGLQQLTAKGWDFGWAAGAQARWDRFELGASYRSAIDRNLDGRLRLGGLTGPLAGANFDAPADVAFATPWSLTVAGRWAATDALALYAQVARTGWSKYDTIELAFAGQGAAIVQGYRDTTSVAAGAEWRASPTWTLRGGVQYDPTPTPAAMREPGVPDSDRTTWAAGATVDLTPGLSLDLAASLARFEDTRLHRDLVFYGGTPAATGATIRGTLRREEFTLGSALRKRF
ncbi:OmpP1/FadL family transporter [Phenylobacterium sp. J367]|uniref:OmpP1/FadL family transporter n=1 Tax=Phenylobacterium sp. J367 TaxID=2898435 RepID=UPI0021509546|nr:outer membrane protein transport protein [Phenylobacterium sp. J367]MCR5877396.1 outer membrane protein transport protein [Phenylobacterium sp. J367]